jgi:hypothetical protein
MLGWIFCSLLGRNISLQWDIDFGYQLSIPYKKLSHILPSLSDVSARLYVAGKMFNTVIRIIPENYVQCRTDILFRLHQHRILLVVTYFKTALPTSQHYKYGGPILKTCSTILNLILL